MRLLRRSLLATTLALLPALAAAQDKAEVIHWWTSGGESAAVRVFAEEFTKAGGVWVDTAIAGGANARTAGINRIVGGNPSTSMQFNTGKQFDELVSAGLLRDIDALAAAGKWKDVLPPGIIKAVTRDGKIYAVPVNIHGQSWLFYNTKVLADAGVEPPATWPEVLAAGDKLKAKGVVPLAFSGTPNWERGLFNAVLSSYGGPDMFRAFWGKRDPAVVKSAKFAEVVELYGKLRGLVDPGSPGRSNWNDATAMVITGKAAMQVMGDWAKGEFIAAGLTAGKEYGCALLGSPGVMVMGGDVFVFPKTSDKAVIVAQDKLATMMMAPATQIAFNMKKGSVPVRTDVDVSGMDICAQKGAKALASPATQLEANELLSPPDVTGAVQDVITQYWNNPGMDTKTFADKIVTAMQSAG